MSDDRLIALEEKFAHQEHALAEMSAELYRQQQHLDHLEQLCRQLAQRLQGLTERLGEDAGTDLERPPHY